jgi:hypothetical protein
MYLSDVEEGGETIFPNVSVSVLKTAPHRAVVVLSVGVCAVIRCVVYGLVNLVDSLQSYVGCKGCHCLFTLLERPWQTVLAF